MNNEIKLKRRQFLKLGAGLSWAGMSGFGLSLLPRLAFASTVGDYKALVCINLSGGNDANNLIVPMDSTRYNAYKNIRGFLALGGNKLLSPIADSQGNPYAFHYGLAEMNPLFNAGHLAVVLNTGILRQPLTRAQFLSGLNAPSNLFSHSDQTVQTHSGEANPLGTGWAGRTLDQLGGGADSLAAVSVSTPALLLQGATVRYNVITPGANLTLWGMNLWPQSAASARRQALNQILNLSAGNPIRQAANKTMLDGLALADALNSNTSLPALSTTFPGTSIGNQLKEVLRMIRLRAQTGPGRQVFYCSLGSFDTHSSQDWQHWNLLSQLSQALNAFFQGTAEAGLDQQVTTFTQSEFNRTLQSNGSGSDHGWGSHQLVLGGAVAGGIYGQMPAFALNGPDDATGRGVWIPQISTAQFGATLGRWFGTSEEELRLVFSNLDQFPSSNIGFMG